MGLSYDEAKVYVERYTCSCGSPLSLAWGGAWDIKEYVIRCGQDPAHTEFERPHALTLGSNTDIPGWRISNKRRRELEEELGSTKARVLAKYVGQAVLQKVDLQDIVDSLFPEAPEVEKTRAIMLCASYGLNPLNKHVFLIPFNKGEEDETWSTVMGIKAKRLLASRRGPFSYIDNTPRRMTDTEQKQTFGTIDTDRIWVITKLRDPKTGAEAVGYGFWLNKDKPKGETKGNTRFNMASIRSESQALDRLRPGEMPQGVEAVEESTVEAEFVDVGDKVVNPRTGEVYGPPPSKPEGGDKVSEPAAAKRKGETVVQERGKTGEQTLSPPKEAKPQKSREAAAAGEKSPDDITSEDIPDFNALAKAAFHFYKLQPSQLWKELGYKSQMDVTETAWECWQKIKAVRS
jgi:hypothetical protein